MTTNYSTSIGNLDSNIQATRAGRKVIEWRYRFPDHRSLIDRTIRIDVFLLDQTGHAPFFEARCERLPGAVQHTDIAVLRTLVKVGLDEQIDLLTGVTWENWLEVVVKGENVDMIDLDQSNRTPLKATLMIEVNRIKRGIHPATGEPITVNHNQVIVPFPRPTKHTDAGETRDGVRISNAPGERSYIPETAENLAALQDVMGRMARLREGLSDLLSHERVGHSTNIGQDPIGLLPAM